MLSFFRKLRAWNDRRRKDEELGDELKFHLDEEAEERQAAGQTPEQAKWAAHRDLGSVALIQERTRRVWTWTLLEQLAQDLRYTWRTMRRNRTFTALAALSLALGIGANTAIYSFMDAILLRSLPVADPQSLALVNWQARNPRVPGKAERDAFVMHSMSGSTYGDPGGALTSGIFPFPAFELLLENADAVFSSVFAYDPARSLNVMVRGHADLASGEYVSGQYFSGLGVPPHAGRLFVDGDDRADAPPVAVLSFGLSQRQFGAPANAIGQSILINSVPFTVVGVTPPEFFGVDPGSAPDVYLPLHTNLVVDATGLDGVTPEQYLDQNYYWIEVMARLRPGVTQEQAQSTLAPLFHQWVAGTASDDERANLPTLLVKHGAGGLDSLRRQYSKPLAVLLTLVGLILAIACANIASLLLARASARRREIAVRLSLGAGRGRVIRQLLTESVFLACAGGVLGTLFASWGIRALTGILANGQERFTLHAELNWRVLGATVAISVLCGTLFGLAPAIQSTRADLVPALKDAHDRAPHLPARLAFLRMNLSRLLVIAQVAISLLLLVAAGLFVRTLSNLHSIQLGFDRENLLLFEVDARQAGHRDPEIVTFYEELQRRLGTIPGVHGVSLAHSSLIGAGRQLPISVSGTPAAGTRILNTGPSFFKTMQIPLLRGREIDERDRASSSPVAVVNELFATRQFGAENPVGQQITLGGPSPRAMEIVGVAASAQYGDLKAQTPPQVVYIPYNQGTFPPIQQMTYVVRTSGDPHRYVNAVRGIVHDADARIPIRNPRSEVDEVARTVNQERVFAGLCTAFAMLALVIACVGFYGTMAYAVVRRTNEIGIRLALGAERRAVVWLVLREVLALTAVGIAISLPLALSASKLVGSLLFGMKPNDPQAMVAAVAILVAAALIAGYAPARRAARIDPLVSLRHE